MKNLIKLILLISLISSAHLNAAEKKKIVVWAMGYEGTQIGKMARIFEQQNPGVEIITQAIPWSAAHEKLLTSIIGGVPPDVCQMGTTWIPEFQSMGAFEPLDEYIKNSKLKESDFFKSSFGIGRIGDRVYGIPWYVDTRVLFYRKDILKEAGYDSPPATWDEFIEICTRIIKDTDNDGEIDRYGISLPVKDEQAFLPVLWQNNGSILSKDHAGINVTDENFAGAAKFYKKFFDNKAAPLGAGHGVLWAFKEGIYPMFISGPWMVNIIRNEAPEIEGKWGVSMLPGNKNRNSFVGGCHLVIFKDSVNKDIAWKFIEFMSDPDNQLKWFEMAGGLPSNVHSWESGYFSDKPFIKVFGNQMLHTKSPPNIPQWEEIASLIKRRIEEFILEKTSITEMQNLLKEDIAKVLTVSERGSKNVVLWFILIVIAGGALFLLYANRALKSKQNMTGIKREQIILEAAPPGGMSGKGWRRYYVPYLFILPAILILLVFLFIPIFSSFLFSLTNWNVNSFSDFGKLRFIGFENYLMLFKDKVFWQALLNTLIFSGVGIPLNIILAFFLAIIIDKKYIQNKAIFRAGYFMPVVTTLVAVAVVWKWLYNPEYGLANYLIGLIGIDRQQWLSSPALALPSLIIMSVWKNFGYNMVIILAGLQTIPASLYEAASVDGADAWQTFWNITLPSLKPTLFFVMIMTTIGSLQFFAEPYIMTDGGPMDKTISMVMYMYQQGFKFFKFGYGTAVAYMLFICILLFTVIQIFYNRKLEAK